jgi:hypothetical protein
MPTLMWIAFCCCLMAAATCWQRAALPIRVKGKDRRDHPAV